MERQLDEAAGRLLQQALEDKGLKFLLRKQTEELVGRERPRRRRAASRTAASIPADLVVMAVGIRPNTALAESAGLHCNRGIVVNDTMQTYDPRIYAVGECVEHRGTAYGLVAPLFEQAKVCANHLAEHGIGALPGLGDLDQAQGHRHRPVLRRRFHRRRGHRGDRLHDAAGGVYKKLVIKDDKLVGAVLYGDTADGAWYFQLLREGSDIAELRDHLMFGQATSATPATPATHSAARDAGRRPKSAAATASARATSSRRSGEGPVHAGRGAQAHQGLGLLRLLHRPGRADPGSTRGRRLLPPRRRQAAVRLHRAHATTKCAPRSREQELMTIPEAMQLPGMADARRLRHLPPGAQLLPDLRPGRDEYAGRPAVALHQRARPRQHPEGRHLLGGAAHVGRRDHAGRTARASPTWPTSIACRR